MAHDLVEPSAPPREPLRVIFLDCDGVLANYRSQMMRFSAADSHGLLFDPDQPQAKPLEKACLENLRWLAGAAGCARLVLTTTWRQSPPLRAFLVRALGDYGLEVLGDTPDLPGAGGRAAEVLAWLASPPPPPAAAAAAAAPDSHGGGGGSGDGGGVAGLCVLDDGHADSFRQADPRLAARYVQTDLFGSRSLSAFDPAAGLTPSKAREALAALSLPWP